MPRSATTPAAVPAITEKAFMRQVVDLAQLLGFRTYHPWLSVRSERGWPDLAIFKPGRFLLVELKAERGKVSPSQEAMIADLKEAGVECHTFRPSQWDELVNVLNRRGVA